MFSIIQRFLDQNFRIFVPDLRKHIAYYLYFSRIYKSTEKRLRSIPLKLGESQTGASRNSNLPIINPIAWWYEKLSTFYIYYSLLRIPIKWYVNSFKLTESPANCYYLGHLYMPTGSPVHDIFPAAFSFYHLVWRLRLPTKKLKLNVIPFMLMDEKLIDDFEVIPKSRLDLMSAGEQQVMDIMCYQVQTGTETAYRRRANRFLPSRNELTVYIDRVLIMLRIPILSMAIIGATMIMNEVLFDLNYLDRYPGCSPDLEELKRKGELSPWSVTLRGHKLISSLFDLLENFILWFDTAGTLSVLAMADFLNYDQIIYWKSIHERLVERLAKCRSEIYRQVTDERPGMMSEYFDANFKSSKLIYNIQCEIGDFFQQLRAAGGFITETLSMSIVTWMCTFLIYLLSSGQTEKFSSAVRALLVMTALTVALESWFILLLSRRVTRSYSTLCSIMALDRSRHKFRFIRVLEYYSKHGHVSYKLINGSPYSTTTFLSFVGWSFSLLVLVETYLHKLW